jgi:hypothetical protein
MTPAWPGRNAMAVRIICIKKAHGQHENPYVAIESLGWTNEATGERNISTREQMYDFVVNQKGDAYVVAGALRAALTGAISPRGTRYVKTVADSTIRDNLLTLPECP